VSTCFFLNQGLAQHVAIHISVSVLVVQGADRVRAWSEIDEGRGDGAVHSLVRIDGDELGDLISLFREAVWFVPELSEDLPFVIADASQRDRQARFWRAV
jgi:hypothetical protein